MKQYIGTKIIKAKPMSRGEYNIYRGWTIPVDEDPADEGYLVKYSDDYVSWSPKDVFEEAYHQCDNMTFGLALEALKKGYKVARKGWNGKGMYVFLIIEDVATQSLGNAMGRKMNPYMVIKNVNDSISTWVPSINDCIAEDWILVKEEA